MVGMGWEDLLDPLFWGRLLAAVICGLIIGAERQLRGKPAGIRTSILVCVGTMTFVRLGVMLHGDSVDPTRVLGQVVTGIGFLGAGVILTRNGLVHGVTSAAVIWILAAAGACIGLDRFGMAIANSVLAVGVLVGVEYLESAYKALRRGVHAHGEDLGGSDGEGRNQR